MASHHKQKDGLAFALNVFPPPLQNTETTVLLPLLNTQSSLLTWVLHAWSFCLALAMPCSLTLLTSAPKSLGKVFQPNPTRHNFPILITLNPPISQNMQIPDIVCLLSLSLECEFYGAGTWDHYFDHHCTLALRISDVKQMLIKYLLEESMDQVK